MALADKDRDAAILEWETGYDADGNESRFAQWEDGDVGGIPTRVRKKPAVEMLRAMLARPDHMVRCDVDAAGQVVIEIEERDELAPSKGAGSPTVYAFEPADKTSTVVSGVSVDAHAAKLTAIAAQAAKEAAYTQQQLDAKAAYEQAQTELEEAKKLALAAGVL